MMMVHIAATTFDLNGHVSIEPLPSSSFGDYERRTNKVKTLDGGVAINDGGYSPADRDYTINWRARDRDFEEKVLSVLRNHDVVRVSSFDGVFLAVPGSYTPPKDGESSLKLLLKEKVN